MANPPLPASRAVDEARPALLGLPLEALAETLAPFVDRPYRVGQIYRALYERGVTDFAAITELSHSMRARLAEKFIIGHPETMARRESVDGTVKYLFRLADSATIETVDIPEARRRTLCVSSQAGCALACRFCVTGFWGGGRNLTAGEIVAQVLVAQRKPSCDAEGLNLVFMGMGEPLLNLDALRDAFEILTQRISRKRITISTAGIVPGIRELASWPRRPRLAISLHAPDDERRNQIMPINQKYPLQDLLSSVREFPLSKRERLTFEYLLIRDFNEALEDADALVELLAGIPAKVNLIPLNEDPVLPESLRMPSRRRVTSFRDRLVARGMTATIRRQRGDDVSAACGQLRVPGREPRGFRRSNLSL